MLNITERALTEALTELLEERPLDKINVVDITDKCGLTRNTFYYHFHDVYDALNCYFTNEIEKMLVKYEHDEDWSGGFLEGLEFVYHHKTMIEHIYNFVDSRELRDYLDSVIFKYALTVIGKEFKKTDYSAQVKEIAADFYTNVLLGATIKWIKDGMKENPENMATLYTNVFYGTIEQTFKSIDESLKQFSNK